jgi:response regulator NasT
VPADAVADPVALAVGVLMHRHSLLRGAAWQRLQRLAAEQGLTLPAQAERLLGAVEELARTGG